MHHRYDSIWLFVFIIVASLCVLPAITPGLSRAQGGNDPVTVTPLESGHGKIVLSVTAGASGTPGGFSVLWMRLADYQARGGEWAPGAAPGQMQADFSGVRTHAGAEAESLNRTMSARAFTSGRDIFFVRGGFQPASADGQRLLAHELTHVVQQGDAAPRRTS